MSDRRNFLRGFFTIGASALSLPRLFAHQESSSTGQIRKEHKAGVHQGFNVPVQTPDVPDLPFTMDNGVKVFHLIAEPVKQQIAPNKTLILWGFNGSAPGPTIQINQGDRIRIIVDNHLPEPTSMHWHGFEIPHNMDGGPGISQMPIKPGGRFIYEFTLHQEGTYFYHSHMAMQEMMGMLGAFIMHPKQSYRPSADKDFMVILQEYAVLPNNVVPNSMNMEFNWLLINGKAGPANTPLIVRLGDRVRIRMINLGMDHHPIHLHGHTFVVTGTEGGRIPESGWISGNTVLVGVAQARDVEFVANNPGDWMLHCHLPHHMMNQMSSNVGPMSRIGRGTPAGVNMENGMGMLTGEPGVPTGEDYGPSLGRGMGFGSTNDFPKSNGPISQKNSEQNMQGMDMQTTNGDIAQNADSVPGFPQDAYMEGPMMAMDQMVDKPQNYGLPPGWSGFMQGMMTLVRVLQPDKYAEVMERVHRGEKSNKPEMPGMEMHDMPGMQHPK
ncbi:MAG: copper oxidase [Acidobacteria bacterium]|nr:MAG: copper oxidase [Acidobacteriota bacterium]PYY20912.1 MAG: copper oxidase [Acidobacteriota bacterium]